MMKVFLSQHAKAMDKEQNPDRPLTDEGVQDIEKVGAYLSVHTEVFPRVIYHSPKTRARQTAEIFARYFEPGEGTQEAEGLKALDDPAIWAHKLADMQEDVFLVGHLPHMSKLASTLLCGDSQAKMVNFTNGCILCLEREEELGQWAVDWMVTPEIHK
jgi:phosphohistidine phosphatase